VYKHLKLPLFHLKFLIGGYKYYLMADYNNMGPKEDNDDSLEEKELSSQMNKTFSRRRSALRIVAGFFSLLIWILIGVSPTILFTSGTQAFIGTFSFLVKNPIIFLLIAFLNIFLGFTGYFLVGILWWAGFHFIWSIRWFYGYNKYRKLKINPDGTIEGMQQYNDNIKLK
jgi:hypothetical protein